MPTVRYVFRDDNPIIKNAGAADPQVIGEAIEGALRGALNTDDEGKPRAIVAAARKRGSPLHPYFEWNDRKAADAHRLQQARYLLASIVAVDQDSSTGTVRAFVSVTESGRSKYHHIHEVKASESLQLALLSQAERDIRDFKLRYEVLRSVCREADHVLETIEAERKKGTKGSKAAAA